MIPIDIADPTVLRRTLEELDDKIPVVNDPITKINAIPATATLAEVIEHVNTIGDRLNIVISAVNSSLR